MPTQVRSAELSPLTQIRNRGLVAKTLLHWVQGIITANSAVGEGVVFGLWDGVKGDVQGVVSTLLAVGDLEKFLFKLEFEPWVVASELYHCFSALKDLGWEGLKSNVSAMIDQIIGDFTNTQVDRLSLLLGKDAEDPVYLSAYFAGYAVGYIGEQVGVSVLTAGIAKAGVIGRVLREGTGPRQSSCNWRPRFLPRACFYKRCQKEWR